MTTKVCSACHTEKALDQFRPAPRYRLGVSGWCIECDRAKCVERYAANREKYAARKREYAKNNPEKRKAVHANWYAKNRAKKLKQNAEWSEKNAERHSDLKRAWRIDNKARANAHTARYRALKKNATPAWLSAIELAQIQEMYDVAIARSIQTGVQHQVDHIHPLQGKGFVGLHVPWNLQVIEITENKVKLNKLPENEKHLSWEYKS